MRAMRVRTPLARFIRFVLVNTITPLIAGVVVTRIWPLPGYDWLWFTLGVTAAFALNGLFWGWAFFLSEGDGLRR